MPRAFAYRNALRRQSQRRQGIHQHAARLVLGQIDQKEFFRVTVDDFRRLSEKLWHAYRTKLPDGVEAEDLAQEMRAEVVRVLPAWNPCLRSVGDYLVFNCYSKAKKWLNRQRNAENRDGRAPSRFPISASRIDKKGEDGKSTGSVLDREVVQPDQQLSLERREYGRALWRELKGAASEEEIAVLIQGGRKAHPILTRPAIAALIERVSRDDVG